MFKLYQFIARVFEICNKLLHLLSRLEQLKGWRAFLVFWKSWARILLVTYDVTGFVWIMKNLESHGI